MMRAVILTLGTHNQLDSQSSYERMCAEAELLRPKQIVMHPVVYGKLAHIEADGSLIRCGSRVLLQQGLMGWIHGIPIRMSRLIPATKGYELIF